MDKKSKGFTLIELMIVISIIGIITAIAIPRWISYRAKAEERVCVTNRMTVQRLFEIYLFENGYDVDDEDDKFFNEFVLINNFDKICTSAANISYEGGRVKCGLHQGVNEEDEDEPPGNEVPWL